MDLKETLASFCQNMITDITKRISESNDDSEGVVLLHTYNEKCKGILAKIKGKDETTMKESVCTILKDISQAVLQYGYECWTITKEIEKELEAAKMQFYRRHLRNLWKEKNLYNEVLKELVLDVTYVQEIELVEDNFSNDTSESDIKSIIDSLSSLESLAKTVCPKDDVVTSLGPEILECLRWRKGALLYMFCHTMHHENPDKGIPSHQHHYLEDGVDYLVSMLKTRCDAKWIESQSTQDCQTDDGDTLQLIQQGIFSDTHLLALMYCGEMCYWHAISSYSTKGTEENAKVKNEKGNLKNNTDSEKRQEKNTTKANEGVVGKSKSSSNNKASSSENESSEKLDKSDKPTDISSGGAHSKGSKTVQTSASSSVTNQRTAASKMVDIGNSCLNKYLSVTKGPLVWAGWSTDRAEDIISSFQNLKLKGTMQSD